MLLAHAFQVPHLSRPYGDPLAGMSLTSWLAFNPDVAFAAWIGRERAMIDLIRIPETRRRRGLGTSLYRLWELGVPEGMTVALEAFDDTATAFWRNLGFTGPGGDRMYKTITRLA